MIRQNLMPKEMLRDWKVQPIGGIFGESAEGKKGPQRCFWKNVKILGIVQKAERDPQDLVFGDSCKKAESDPQRYYGKSAVEPYSQRVYDEDNYWGETSDIRDGQPCCVGSDCHQVVHLNSLLVMGIMLTL